MIHFGSYIHREEFEDLIWRWFHNNVRTTDPDRVTRLVHFNNTYVSNYLDLWSQQLFSALAKDEARRVRIHTKAELKDALVSYPHYRTDHIDSLIRYYFGHKEKFYLETPIHANLYFCGQNAEHRLVGSNRIKRTIRMAEKSARRIIDMIFSAIKKRAEDFADIRAKSLGIPRAQLLSSADVMIREFEEAEKHIIADLRNGLTFPKVTAPPVNDVAGLKVILEKGEENKLYDYLESRTRCDIVEIEPHHNKHYHATNLIVRGRPQKDMLVKQTLNADLVSAMRARGLWKGDVQKEYEEFVYSGEDHIYFEIIFASYEDILESEIGKSMHEDRIIDQRQRQEYQGHLARNIEYLVQYIFTFASFPSETLEEIPIKVWKRYLPDYYFEVVKNLYRITDPYAG